MSDTWKERFSKCLIVPQRYFVSIMCSLALFTIFAIRGLMPFAIAEMVYPEHETKNFSRRLIDSRNVPGSRMVHYWDKEIQEIILSSFYWGYIVTHIPGALLAQLYGGKYTLGFSLLGTATFSLFTPIVIDVSGGFWSYLVSWRVLNGFCQGAVYPSLTSILAQWIPAKEKTTILSFTYAAAHLGSVISVLGDSANKTWSTLFYFFGSCGVVWFIVWQVLCYSNPDSHPFIKEKEKLYLRQELEEHVNQDQNKNIPWKEIFCSIPVWTLVIIEIGHDWGWFIMVMELPKYMKNIKKFKIEDHKFWTSLPYLSSWTLSIIIGLVSDFLINKKWLNTTTVRKIFGTLGYVGPAIFLLLASYSSCNKAIVVSSFSVGVSLMSAYYSSVKVNPLDLSPNFAGLLTGLINGLGIVTGIMAPFFLTVMAPDPNTKQRRYVFWISFYVYYTFSNVVFLIFASGDVQPWNNPLHI